MSANVYALTVTYNAGGQFAQNVLKYQFDDAGYTDTASAANALILAWQASKLAALMNICPTAVTAVSLKARSITTGGGFESVVLLSSGNVGLRSGAMQATGVCPVGIWAGANNAKARGKTFIPGVADGDLVDGIYATSFINAFVTWQTAQLGSLVLTGGGSPTATFGIYQRKPVPSFIAATSGRLAPIPGTLLRRQRPA